MQRPISPFETTYFRKPATADALPLFDVAIYIGSTVTGTIDAVRLRAVLAELAATHPLLRCRAVEDSSGALSFIGDDAFVPALDIVPGGVAGLSAVVDAPPDWSAGLFRAYLCHDGDQSRVLLAVHHGISDGRSAHALLDEMWRRYTAHTQGQGVAVEQRDALPEATDGFFAATTDQADVLELCHQLSAAAAAGGLGGIATLPPDPDHAEGTGNFGIERIELTTGETTAFLDAAHGLGVTANSLLMSCALLAIRSQLTPSAGALPLMCGYTADMRSWLSPAISADVVVNAAFGSAIFAAVESDVPAAVLAPQVHAQLHEAITRRDPVRYLLARQSISDPATAAVLATPPSLLVSNIGAVAAPVLPSGMDLIHTEIFVVGVGMPPTMLVLTQGGRLAIQLEYDARVHSPLQMAGVRQALIHALCAPQSAIRQEAVR